MKLAHALFLSLAAAGPALAQAPAREPEMQSARIIQTVTPDFPAQLYAVYSHGGAAGLVIALDADGKLKDWLVISYSAPKFADLALAAVKQWKFEPARWRGEPVPVCITLNFTFKVKGVVVSSIGSDSVERFRLAMFTEMGSHRLYTLRELDRIPVPVRADSPFYPKALADQGVTGEVVVGFYIDEQGAVRMPFVISWPHNNLADYAIEAVQRWKFEPPTHDGRPVMAYVHQIFRFGLAPAP